MQSREQRTPSTPRTKASEPQAARRQAGRGNAAAQEQLKKQTGNTWWKDDPDGARTEEGALDHVKGVAIGVGEGASDAVTGIAGLLKGAWNVTAGWLTDPAQARESTNHLVRTVQAIADDPGVVIDAITQPVEEDWEAGRQGEAVGRVLVEVASALLGAKGVDKVSKSTKVLGALEDGSQIVNKLDDVSRAADKIEDVSGSADKIADASKTSDTLEDVGTTGDKIEGASTTGDRWSRSPRSVQDKMALDAAKRGEGTRVMENLGDPRFQGFEKWEYKLKSAEGRDSVVHYVRNPKTGELMDFKFTKHSTNFAHPKGS